MRRLSRTQRRPGPRRDGSGLAGRFLSRCLPASSLTVLLAILLTACGSATATDAHTPAGLASAAPTTAPPVCAATVASTLGAVGERIYHEAATGGNVAQALARVRSSSALASAVSRGDASAARAALRALLLKQIVGIEILRGGRVFATAGSGSAIAPVRGSIPGTGASFILSVQADRTYLQVANRITGAQILLTTRSAGSGGGTRLLAGTIVGPPPASVPTSGSLSSAGRTYQVFSFTGAVYPSGPLRVAVLVPSAVLACPGSAAQARVETLGHVGERIYAEELHSPEVSATLRHIEGSSSFQRAVAAADASAARAAIVGLFGQHIHVVRVRVTIDRATIGQRLLVDVGGPFALAPAHGTLRSGGRVVGHFTMAIQDDAGYLKLARLFTGAEVLMRTGGRQVMGTLNPGPATVPDRGEVAYRGRTYQAYSFTGEAFPSGPLRLSLLLPS